MWILICLFALVSWAADQIKPSVATLSAELEDFDLMSHNSCMLMSRYKEEMENIGSLFNGEAKEFLEGGGHEKLKFILSSSGFKNPDLTLRLLRNYLAFFANASTFVEIYPQYFGNQNHQLLLLTDQILESLLSKASWFMTIFFKNDTGSVSRFEARSLIQMSLRRSNPKAWVRIVFAILDKYHAETESHELAGFQVVTQNSKGVNGFSTFLKDDLVAFVSKRIKATQSIVVSLLKMQYIISLLLPGAILEDSPDKRMSLIVELGAYFGYLMIENPKNPEPTLPACVQILNETAAVTHFYNIIYSANETDISQVPPTNALILEFLCEARDMILPECPHMSLYLSTHCGYKNAEQELLAMEEKEEEEKGKKKKKKGNAKGKNSPKKKKAESKRFSGIPDVETQATVAKDVDSDCEVDQLTVAMESLSVTEKPVNWTHTKAWLTSALIHVAEYCRVKVLYPHFFPNGNVPAKFAWNNLVNQQSSDEIKFCVKAVNKRNAIVQSDEIFKFLPDLETTGDMLVKHFTFDREALDFVMTFAPANRLNENPRIESTVMSETSARFKLMILGLHRACNRVRHSMIDIKEVSSLCQAIKQLRNSHAHPKELGEMQIEALKNELKDWI